MLRKFWGGLRRRETPAKTVLTENSPISMGVAALHYDSVRRYRIAVGRNGSVVTPHLRDPGYLESIEVVFDNRTGASVAADCSFWLERQQYRKWYAVPQGSCYGAPWEHLKIPEGRSERMILPVFGRYDYLRHGRYRAVKCLQTNRGAIHDSGGIFHWIFGCAVLMTCALPVKYGEIKRRNQS